MLIESLSPDQHYYCTDCNGHVPYSALQSQLCWRCRELFHIDCKAIDYAVGEKREILCKECQAED